MTLTCQWIILFYPFFPVFHTCTWYKVILCLVYIFPRSLKVIAILIRTHLIHAFSGANPQSPWGERQPSGRDGGEYIFWKPHEIEEILGRGPPMPLEKVTTILTLGHSRLAIFANGHEKNQKVCQGLIGGRGGGGWGAEIFQSKSINTSSMKYILIFFLKNQSNSQQIHPLLYFRVVWKKKRCFTALKN